MTAPTILREMLLTGGETWFSNRQQDALKDALRALSAVPDDGLGSNRKGDLPTEPFIPVPGQSFSSEQEWINRATRRLTSHADYNNTEHGDATGWRGPHFTAMSFDQAGNRMRNGGDFKRATAEGTYPVWWVWPDQINDLLRAGA